MVEMPARDPSCPCSDGCAVPGCSWDAISCGCPMHGSGTPASKTDFGSSCDECAGCKAARNPEL